MPALVLRRLLLGTIVAGALVGIWTAVVLLLVRGDLLEARAALEQGRDSVDIEAAGPALQRAEERLDRAVSRLQQPGPALAARVPVLGRTVQAVDRTAAAALAVTRGLADVVQVARDDDFLQPGGVDLTALQRLGDALDAAGAQVAPAVAELTAQDDRFVPSVVADPLAEAQAELGGTPESLAQAGTGIRALSGLLGAEGPRRLLVVLENNAELRGTGGLVSVFAEATANGGRLDVEGFQDVEAVADDPPDVVRVPAPPDYTALWGPYLADSTLWVNTNMSPDIPTSSTVLARVAAATLAQPPDAVLWLDVPAIAAVLEATGPVTLPDGQPLRGEDAVEVLLSRAYVDAPDTREGQAQRRATLRAVADAVLSRLLGGSGAQASLTTLGPALVDAAAGRHLALWSADEQEQALLLEAGLAGAVQADGGDLASMTVQNLGGGDTEGNKLDYYARRAIEVQATVDGESAQVVQRARLQNDAPAAGLPRYVAGGVAPGTTNNLVSFAVPDDAEQVVLRRGGRQVDTAPVQQGDHDVVVDLVSLPPGTAVDWEVSYVVPVTDGAYRLSVVPQPLHAPAELTVRLHAAQGRRLEVRPGGPLEQDTDGRLTLEQQFEATRELAVTASRPAWPRRLLDNVARFWREPVTLP